MPQIILAVLTLLLGPSAADEIGRQQLVQLVDAAQSANCGDVKFDYEGRHAVKSDGAAEEIERSYIGSFAHRDDGASLVDLYQFVNRPGEAAHVIIAVLKKTITSSTRAADQKNAQIGVRQQSPFGDFGTGNFREIYLVDAFKQLAETPYYYEFEGIRPLDGFDCVGARFRLMVDDTVPKEQLPSYVFWIDLNRGGHVVRREYYFPGEKLAELTTIRLHRLELQAGKGIWLPVSGRVQGFLTSSPDRKPVFVAEPVAYSTYELLPPTLKVDQGLKDDFFSVKPRRGDVVSDQIRKAQYEFGQYMVRPATVTRKPTDAEIKSELDRMLQDSKVMAKELKASSPDQEGSVLWSLWPWAIAGVTVLISGVLYYRQRRE